MRKENKLVYSCPAYDVIEPNTCMFTGYPLFKDNDVIAVKLPSSRYLSMFTFGSVVSYALERNDCPLEAVKDATERGHKLYWLNANCVTISSGYTPRETYYAAAIGDEVLFEGKIFKIEKDWNNNLKLVDTGKTRKSIMWGDK